VNNKIFFGIIFISVVCLVGWVIYFVSRPTITIVQFPNGQKIQVEVVSTDTARERGLSNRDSIAEDQGMLFLFDVPGLYPFWMKDMRFSIDLIWIQGDVVSGLIQNMPPENPPVTNYRPKTPVDKVLELKSGAISAMNLKIGDKLDITTTKQ